MGNGGSGYYPGVDPDGHGGLEAAGSIIAANIPAVDEIFISYQNPVTTVHSSAGGANTAVSWGNIQSDASFVTIDANPIYLDITKDGVYFVLFSIVPDSGTIGAGRAICDLTGVFSGQRTNFPASGSDFDNSLVSASAMSLNFLPAGAQIRALIAQNSGSDVDFDSIIYIARLKS